MTVSHHMLRRTAREKARRLTLLRPYGAAYTYAVERAERGPWRWRVVKVTQ